MIAELKQAVVNFLQWRRMQYLQTFSNEAGKNVLADLAVFCRANESTFHADPRAHAVLEGRREVWLRLQNHLRLTDEELYELYGRKKGPAA